MIINSYRYAGGAAPSGLLLDDYPNAAAAYSLRQLRTGVTNVVRVRDDGDNSEANYTAAEVSAGLTAIGADSGFIVNLYDQSGNTNNASNATTSSQPRVLNSGALEVVNAKPAFNMLPDAVKRELTLGTAVSAAVHTTFIVFKRSTATNAVLITDTNAYTSVLFINDTNVRYKCSGTNYSFTSGFSFVNGNQYLLTIVRTTSISASLYVNGTFAQTITVVGNFVFDRIGNTGSLTNEQLLQEIVHYNSDQSANRAAIEAEINAHYGIY